MAFKKILLGAFFLVLGLHGIQGKPTQASHMGTEDFFVLDRSETAALQGGNPEYKGSGIFVSEVYQADHSFELLGLNWTEELPKGTAASLEIRFLSAQGEWSEWEAVEADGDGPDGDSSVANANQTDGTRWSYVMTQKSVAFQYRANLSTETKTQSPKLSNISFDYVEGGSVSPLTKLAKMVFDADSSIISREEWGADESLRLSKSTNTSFESELDTSSVTSDPEMKIVKTVEVDDDGNPLLWPEEYPAEVKKIFIHHTATTENLDDPEAAIRAIYYYHAITRGWGDIGYNFIVAPDGSVYEGRAGGDGVVAGHAQGYNTGSIGIALLGNYQENPIPGETMKSLAALIYEKAKLHKIDPDGSSKFRGEVTPNIMGHRDVSSTACPGQYMYDSLEEIRTMVGNATDVLRSKGTNKEYAFTEIGDRELALLNPQESESITVKIKNTGTQTWNNKTYLVVNTDAEAEKIISIPKDSNKQTASMKESSVKPGSTATFTFTATAKTSGGLASFDMTPVFNGTKKTDHLMDLGFYVELPVLKFSVASNDAPSLLKPGASASVTVTLKNTGTLTWENSGDNAVTLVQTGDSDLVSSTSLATLKEDSVEPGEKGTFTFTIQAPSKSGSYTLYFAPDMENANVLVKGSGQLTVKVAGSTDDALVLAASTLTQFEPGESKMLWVQVQNTSSKTWKSTGSSAFKLSISDPEGGAIGKQSVSFKTLKAGFSGKAYFKVTAPKTAGTYVLKIWPKLGSSKLTSSAYELSITVGEEELDPVSYEDAIRIRLTPDSEISTPVFTVNTTFGLYDNETLLKAFPAKSRIRVEEDDGAFTLYSSSKQWTVKGPVRFVPEEGGVVTFLSMEQRPAWNTSLNDNQFRGVMEIRDVEGEMAYINELPLEDYLKGIGEVSNGDPTEKIKTIVVLARSYATYYMTVDEKFSGMPYDLDDDPNASQKYLGYGYELRSPNTAAAVKATEGKVVTYQGEVVKTPYFSKSDGVATKSAKTVWGWTNTPWLVSVPDTWCQSTAFSGHGVGLSGCGATALAEAGKSFTEIIEYYYTGVDVEKL